MGSSANVLTKKAKQVYSLTRSPWPLEQFSMHRQSPLSRLRVTVAIWGSGTNACHPACGSQLHKRPTCACSVSRTSRLSHSSTRSPNANSHENNNTTAVGPGRVLFASYENNRKNPKPCGGHANVQSDHLYTCSPIYP